MNISEILGWLKCNDKNKLQELWEMSNAARQEVVGNDVHLRGLIEFSNYCCNLCAYCGINRKRKNITRYRMTAEEILLSAKEAMKNKIGTIVLQSGYDPSMPVNWFVEILQEIKRKYPIAITLSIGERTEKELETLRLAGADRYLLRFETSDPILHAELHPHDKDSLSHRLMLLKTLRCLGYQIGSGMLIGLPGQCYRSLAYDILLLRKLQLDMIGVGPYISHPETDLFDKYNKSCHNASQVPNDELTSLKVLSLIRLTSSGAHIPSTTAMASINPEYSYLAGLMCGANVIMPNLTQ